jgi:hypothetical protein
MAITGPLADNFLLPGMMPGGSLTPLFGWLIGTDPGAGISLLFTVMGITGVAIGLGGYIFERIRNVESLLPDHDAIQLSTTKGTQAVE